MPKHCEASRGHISRLLSTGLSVHQRASSLPIEMRPKAVRIGTIALESYAPFRCVQSVVLVPSMPLRRQWLILQIDCCKLALY